MWISKQHWLNAQSDLDAARGELAAATAAVAALTAERDAAVAARAAAEAEAKKLNNTLDTLCHQFQLPRKALYSSEELAAAGRKQKMRSQLGPEIGFILNEAKRRGMI